MNDLIITFDIETIPTQRQDVADYIASTIKPPKTMSVAATIEKWHKESKADAIEEEVSRTGLDGAFGQVCVIGFAIGGAGPLAVWSDCDEASVLNQFNRELDEIPRSLWSAYTLIGHNISGFDLRFLYQRYIVNGIPPHPMINIAVNAKPWDGKYFDTMTQWAGHGKMISLDKLCMALGVPTSKGDMDGSMVGQAVADGLILEVVEYCKRDVSATRAIYKRMVFAKQ